MGNLGLQTTETVPEGPVAEPGGSRTQATPGATMPDQPSSAPANPHGLRGTSPERRPGPWAPGQLAVGLEREGPSAVCRQLQPEMQKR